MLHFDIDWSQLRSIGQEFGATDKQVRLALARALARTASKLRTLSAKGLRSELELKRLGDLRKRLKTFRIRMVNGESMKLWYGLNDMPVSWFRGTPKQTKAGAEFRGVKFKGAFVSRKIRGSGKTIYEREGGSRFPLNEKLMPVQDRAQTYIEDNVFTELEPVFWAEFNRELKARVKFKIGEA